MGTHVYLTPGFSCTPCTLTSYISVQTGLPAPGLRALPARRSSLGPVSLVADLLCTPMSLLAVLLPPLGHPFTTQIQLMHSLMIPLPDSCELCPSVFLQFNLALTVTLTSASLAL